MAATTELAYFTFPNRILFGIGSRKELRNELARLGTRHPLVVTDRGVIDAGLLEMAFGRSGSLTVFDEVEPNPTEANCIAGLAVYRARGCDGVIGLGGGSSLDAAKAIRLMSTHGGSLAD